MCMCAMGIDFTSNCIFGTVLTMWCFPFY